MPEPAHNKVAAAYQGAPGAYSHWAASLFVKSLGNEGQYISCRSFDELFASVLDGQADYAIVPLENSSVGSITANYDLLWRSNIFLVGEVILPVHHCLMAKKDTKYSELQEILSHPVALEQCRGLFKKLPQAKPTSFWDTGGAAEFIAKEGNNQQAAIASKFASTVYNLQVLEENVEDFKQNTTRFGIASLNSNTDDLKPPYKLTCAFELSHEPGSLAKTLGLIASLGINLTKIESRPIPEQPWHYRFFVDLEFKDQEQKHKENSLIVTLIEQSNAFKVIGRYSPWNKDRKFTAE